MVVLVELPDQSLQLHCVPVSCPLQTCDRGTGQVLRSAVTEQLYIPHLADLQKREGVFIADASTIDRAIANDLCEEGLSADLPDAVRMRLPCSAHIASTVQGRVFGCVGGLISGIIACSLAMRPSGAVNCFRAQVAKVLKASAVVHDVARPALDDPRVLHRNAVFDLFLPPQDLGSQ